MEGGATGGDCAIGSLVMDTAPTTIRNRAVTHAKKGRAMKNLAIRQLPRQDFLAAEALGAAAGAPGFQGTAFTGAPGGSICSFITPSTTTCSPALRPSRMIHWPSCTPPTLTGRGSTLPPWPTTSTV